MRSSLLRRSLASVALILGAATGTALPIAHAYAEAASASAVAHVEEPGSPGCPQAHDEQACQLCRVVRLASQPSATTVVGESDAVVLPPESARGERLPAHDVEPGASPRAPPADRLTI